MLGLVGFYEAVGHVEAAQKRIAGVLDVERVGVSDIELVHDDVHGRRLGKILRDGAEEHGIDVRRNDAGIRKRLSPRSSGYVGAMLPLRRVMAARTARKHLHQPGFEAEALVSRAPLDFFA